MLSVYDSRLPKTPGDAPTSYPPWRHRRLALGFLLTAAAVLRLWYAWPEPNIDRFFDELRWRALADGTDREPILWLRGWSRDPGGRPAHEARPRQVR